VARYRPCDIDVVGGRAPAAPTGHALYHPRMPDLLLILIVILVLVVLWRGPKTLPKLGEALGRGVKEAKTEATKAQAEIQARASDDSTPTDANGDRPT
jgi:Sec-independent protein translocase protein TatA